MEGDQTQQIRTMARDLARAQQTETQKAAAEKPKAPASPELQRGEPVLDISKKPMPLRSSLVPPPIPPRIVPPKPTPITPPPQTPAPQPRSLADILNEARKRAEQPTATLTMPVPPPVKPTTALQAEDILPIEDVTETKRVEPKEIEPPHNLPTGGEKTPAKAPDSRLKTPEEILGLPAKPAPAGQTSFPARPSPPQLSALGDKRMKMETNAPTPTPTKPPTKKLTPLSGSKFALIAGVLGIVTIAVLGILVWKIFIQEPPPPPPPPPQPTRPTERPIPEALVLYDQREIITINKLKYDSLKPLLDALHLSEPAPDSLTYVLVKLIGEKEMRYLTLTELLTTLQIDAPPTFAGYENYSLFLYSQKNSAVGICAEAKITDELCFSPRLGLVVKLPEIPREDQPEALYVLPEEVAKNAMREWEKTLSEDLRPLMLFAPQPHEQTDFQTGQHAALATRYLNMPVHTMSIDWILTERHLIIATSKDAARAAVGRLVE